MRRLKYVENSRKHFALYFRSHDWCGKKTAPFWLQELRIRVAVLRLYTGSLIYEQLPLMFAEARIPNSDLKVSSWFLQSEFERYQKSMGRMQRSALRYHSGRLLRAERPQSCRVTYLHFAQFARSSEVLRETSICFFNFFYKKKQ